MGIENQNNGENPSPEERLKKLEYSLWLINDAIERNNDVSVLIKESLKTRESILSQITEVKQEIQNGNKKGVVVSDSAHASQVSTNRQGSESANRSSAPAGPSELPALAFTEKMDREQTIQSELDAAKKSLSIAELTQLPLKKAIVEDYRNKAKDALATSNRLRGNQWMVTEYQKANTDYSHYNELHRVENAKLETLNKYINGLKFTIKNLEISLAEEQAKKTLTPGMRSQLYPDRPNVSPEVKEKIIFTLDGMLDKYSDIVSRQKLFQSEEEKCYAEVAKKMNRMGVKIRDTYGSYLEATADTVKSNLFSDANGKAIMDAWRKNPDARDLVELVDKTFLAIKNAHTEDSGRYNQEEAVKKYLVNETSLTQDQRSFIQNVLGNSFTDSSSVPGLFSQIVSSRTGYTFQMRLIEQKREEIRKIIRE